MPHPKQIDFGFNVARLSRRLRQAVDAELQTFGLTDATWRPLAYVGRLGGGVRQKELATALGIEGPSLVRLLDNLEAAGLIKRKEGENDRRAKIILLTARGRAIADKVEVAARRIRGDALAGLSDKDIATTVRVLKHVCRALATSVPETAS